MKDTVFVKPGQVKIANVAKPKIQKDDDVILHVVRTCVCGSDLWSYRGLDDKAHNSNNNGHEAIGIVEEVGKNITTVKPGDFVIAPFTHGCGHCAACLAGFDGDCLSHSDNNSSDYQAEYVRYQHAEWSLVKIPGNPDDYSDGMLNSFLALSDVMATGYHAARTARVSRGDTVAVVGDGAVGLCGVISAKLRGAKQIIALSGHKDRQQLAVEFGATDIVAERGDDAVKHVMKLTHNHGADAVLECVGTDLTLDTALKIARPGASVGRVGLPHSPKMNAATTFLKNISLSGGIAAVTTYDKSILLKAVLDGDIHPGKVFNKRFSLDDIDNAYKAMVDRKAIKSLIVVD
ncbi:Zn-dependent alcohol dehydrogenase [Philodulcilactobacillus myokoensis]|uniref:Zn-dependent alcohol dehydrogenase n=1 Tax=Philodulcilactobacillus myokoensis TaxID=2929573 RepID=A0A9W6B278_9LACO|nr:zinc-binding dehydrogenase [Philodulcilactobacillus myokoensis]GLB47517.1 Zn-dependent alcohol dehydrogenase [Philodulcilactobacillus myokoensis]